VKDVSTSYDALLDLFDSLGVFLERLNIYIKISPTPAMTGIIVKIMVEMLSTIGLATKQITQGRLSELILADSSRNSTRYRKVRKEAFRRE
jgi:hypothetical protein